VKQLKLLLVLPFLLFLNFISTYSTFAHQVEIQTHKVYLAKVYTTKHHKIVTGILYSVSDSTISIQRRYHHQDVWQDISYGEINKITIRKLGGGAIGFAAGAGASITFGVLGALHVTDEEDPDTYRTTYILLGVICAIPIGACCAIAGTVPQKVFKIKMDFKNFQKAKTVLNAKCQKPG
jgi:hypothetical protein